MASLRPTIMGTRHVVAAGHYLAAHAGFEILEAGGNAVDAGVAAGIALGVLQPDKVSFGGVAPLIVFDAKTRAIHNLDGLGVWPAAVQPDYFEKHHAGRIPVGVLRCVVPAAPDAWLTALERWGTMSFGEVASFAQRFAAEGFPMYPLMSQFVGDNASTFKRWPSNEKLFFRKGKVIKPGQPFVQPDLGRTLQYMIDQEKAGRRKGRKAGIRAARDAFYKGDIAAKIVDFVQREGGFMRMEDFAGFSVKAEQTVKARFGGVDVHCCGPWSQGPVVAMALNLLKRFDLEGMGHNSAQYIHVVTEALKLAFADRHMHFGDPDFVDVPMKGLMSERYSDHRRGMIRMNEAWPEMPPAGDPKTLADVPHRWMTPPEADDAPGPGDTTYLCVIDRHGNAFSATPSDGSTGTPIVPGVGLVCSGRGTQSWGDTTHPCSVEAFKRPRLTPNPALAMKNGKALMPFGTPGGDVQPQAMLQVFLNVNVFGMDAQTAIEAPRFAGYSYPGSFEPHEYFPGRLYLEARIPKSTGDALAKLGHKVFWWDEWTWLAGAPCTIVNDHKTGVLHGGADPRRPAYVLGW
jgi:gamma-glutamyltranspeptidase/glutathione hydrolase